MERWTLVFEEILAHLKTCWTKECNWNSIKLIRKPKWQNPDENYWWANWVGGGGGQHQQSLPEKEQSWQDWIKHCFSQKRLEGLLPLVLLGNKQDNIGWCTCFARKPKAHINCVLMGSIFIELIAFTALFLKGKDFCFYMLFKNWNVLKFLSE